MHGRSLSRSTRRKGHLRLAGHIGVPDQPYNLVFAWGAYYNGFPSCLGIDFLGDRLLGAVDVIRSHLYA